VDDRDPTRAALAEARRLVVKIGSRSLAHDPGRFGVMADQVAAQRAEGRTVVLVSSGAVALGGERLGLGRRPKSIARLQAAAAAGQSLLMRAYEDAFAPHGCPVAQVLLTHADVSDRDRYLNARAAIDSLVELGAVPIINENDAVSVEEIRFGDNDQLAAMVATLVGADLLILLTDVEGVLDEQGARVRVVREPSDVMHLVRPPSDDVGLGGMASKLDSARLATRRGVPVVIADARDGQVVARVLAGEDVGTLFLPRGTRMASRKHWIAFTLKPQGTILVDAGAAEAVAKHKRSLLPAGVVGVAGDFEAGDAVRVVGPDGREIARGLARYRMRDVARLAGARTAEIEVRIGRYGGEEIVHRDDLVVQ
jgi:glutamate 5-kinase